MLEDFQIFGRFSDFWQNLKKLNFDFQDVNVKLKVLDKDPCGLKVLAYVQIKFKEKPFVAVWKYHHHHHHETQRILTMSISHINATNVIFPCRQFEETFENAQRRKVKHVQPI